ncbi:hypothetical protein ACFOOL_13275 [Devosia honganensis]|uniref:Uncharacterized protein n=1 Tax=Devosia honganensis TaxID=1610527 RepID=A0ABV7X3H5_9HYPH
MTIYPLEVVEELCYTALASVPLAQKLLPHSAVVAELVDAQR